MQDIAKKRRLYLCPGVNRVVVQRDVEFRGADGEPLSMDVYSQAGARSDSPAVVIASGYRDEGFRSHVGCRFKEMGSSVSWAEAIAASGMRAITYTNQRPADDFRAVVDAVSAQTDRIGIWASSGNGPVALSALMDRGTGFGRVVCAELFYAFTLGDEVATAAASFGFANPCSGGAVDDLRGDVPLFVARAGQDQCAGLNRALDVFVADGLRRNLPLTVVNHADGPHAFDLVHDSPTTRIIALQALQFLRVHLLGAAS